MVLDFCLSWLIAHLVSNRVFWMIYVHFLDLKAGELGTKLCNYWEGICVILEIILKIDGGKWGKWIPSKKEAAIPDCRLSGQKASPTVRFHTGCPSRPSSIAAIACGGYAVVRAVPAAASPTTATTGGFDSSVTATADAAAASSEGCVSYSLTFLKRKKNCLVRLYMLGKLLNFANFHLEEFMSNKQEIYHFVGLIGIFVWKFWFWSCKVVIFASFWGFLSLFFTALFPIN